MEWQETMKEKEPYFSVIILAYQVEAYIKECIDSVLNQSFSDFEIILVNPHGTDNTDQICMRYAEQNKNIKLLKIENRGQLLNRIAGFSIAKGKYFLCLDGDDLWKDNLLESIYNTAVKYSYDLFLFNYVRFCDNHIVQRGISIFPDNTFFSKEKKEMIYQKMIGENCLNPIWIKAFSRTVYLKINKNFETFSSIRRAEDVLYSFYIVQASQNILYMDQPLYYYRIRNNSITHIFRKEELDDILKVKKEIRKFMKTLEGNSKIYEELFLQSLVKSFTDWIYRCSTSRLSFKEKKVLYQRLSNEPLYQESFLFQKKVKLQKQHRLFLILHCYNFYLLEIYAKIFVHLKKLKR